MATERTAMTPDGDVVHFEVPDVQYMSPNGDILDAGLESSAGTDVLLADDIEAASEVSSPTLDRDVSDGGGGSNRRTRKHRQMIRRS